MTTNIGILWLEDNAAVNAGYICTGETAEHIKRIPLNELPRQFIWIANHQSHKFKQLNLGVSGNIKNSKFLGFTLSQVAIDLNLPDDLNEKLPILYKVIHHFVERIEKAYRIQVSDARFSILALLNELITLPQFHSRPNLNGRPCRDLEQAIANSIQKVQGVLYRPDRDMHKVVMGRFPRSPYFLTIVNQIYPQSHTFEETREFEGKIIGINQQGNTEADSQDTIAALLKFGENKAGVIRFAHNSTVPKYQNAFPLGKEVVARPPREWATIPEIIDMANYNSITLGRCYFTNGSRLANVPPIPEASDQFFISYVNGLVNEVTWMAMSHDSNSALTAYMRAYDRILCRQKAQSLVDGKYELAGFSGGSIRCFIRKDDRKEAKRFVTKLEELKLIPQFSILS